jgi:hypothetical protein
MSVEQQRCDSFGRLEDGLRDASDWNHFGPRLLSRHARDPASNRL